MAATKKTLQQQADEILERAQKRGVANNYFFQTTFKRYQVQLQAMEELEKAIFEMGATVTKEYVKGRQNVVVNPAITEYNKTATAANGTVSTLINIIRSFADEDAGSGKLGEFLAAMRDE